MIVSLQAMLDESRKPPEGVGVQLYRPDADGELVSCWVCKGAGRLARGDECRLCGGKGQVGAVPAWRWVGKEPVPEEALRFWRTVPMRERQATMRLAEMGGGWTNRGEAKVICGLHGEKLISFGGRARCNDEHAIFWPKVAMQVNVAHRRGDGFGSVELLSVDQVLATVEVTCLWSFKYDDDGWVGEVARTDGGAAHKRLEFPDAAVRAAVGKSLTYHCRSAVWADGRYARGPSGALRGAGAAWGGMPSPLKGPGLGYRHAPLGA